MARNTRNRQKQRTDGYSNAVIGYGVRNYDPYESFGFKTETGSITADKLERLFNYNGIANKIITAPVDDSIRSGFTLKNGDEELIQDDKLQSTLEELNIERVLKEALSWNRLFGGALIVLRINDGGELIDELNIEKVAEIDGIHVYDPQDVSVYQKYEDISMAKYGKPEIYSINSSDGANFEVHESRCIRLNGDVVTRMERARRDGWGGNVLERIQADLLNYNVSLRNVLMILQRLSQGVLKLNELTAILSTPEGESLVRKRMNLIDKARSIDNTIVIDGTDDYELHNIGVGGIVDIINAFRTSLSSVTDIPLTRLFGQSPAGQNATGESDLNNYYNMIDGIRVNNIKPILIRIIDLIDRASAYHVTLPEYWTVEFNPLKMLDEKELADVEKIKAETRKTEADAYSTLISANAIDPVEVRGAIAKTGDIELSNTPNIDDEPI